MNDALDRIYHKTMLAVERANVESEDVIAVTLALAFDYIADVFPNLPAGLAPTDPQVVEVLEHYEQENERIGAWLQVNEPKLYHDPDITYVDGILTALSKRDSQIAALRSDLERLQTSVDTEVADLRQQLAQLDADNASLIKRNQALALPHAVVNGAVSTPSTNDAAPRIDDVADALALISKATTAFDQLDRDVQDYWIGITNGRWTWKQIPRRIRLAMVRHVISICATNGKKPSQREFNDARPSWMATAQSHALSFGIPWSDLSDLTKDVQVKS